MARVQTLASMIEDCRERADMTRTRFITDATITRWLNKAICSVWDMMVFADPGYGLAETPFSLTTAAGTTDYALDADFYQCRGVDRITNGHTQRCERLTFQSRIGTTQISSVLPRWEIRGTNAATRIAFDPDPGAADFLIHYVTTAPVLVDDADEFDGLSGWEDWPILKVVISMLNKAKEDSRAIERELAAVQGTAQNMARERNAETEVAIAITRPSLRRGNVCW